MKLHTFFLATQMLVAAIGATPQDPFAPQDHSEWQDQCLTEKPYQLEIAYGETEGEFQLDKDTHLPIINTAFFDDATHIRIATSAKETGEIDKEDEFLLRYTISELQGGVFKLKIDFSASKGIEQRGIYSEFDLKLSEWVVLGGLTHQIEGNGPKMTYSIAIRLNQRAQPE
jgi:hypothetical protein